MSFLFSLFFQTDLSSYPKKSTVSPSHQDSSDSGVDLSLSTNSSVQYPSTHLIVHRPLSALNEDSSPDEGYPDDQIIQPVRLRFPPVSFGRNRSMEDMLTNHSKHLDEQHRSSSFTDERKLKRSSDGALLELYETTATTSKDFYSNQQKNLSKDNFSRSHDQHRSINDFNQKNVHQGKRKEKERKEKNRQIFDLIICRRRRRHRSSSSSSPTLSFCSSHVLSRLRNGKIRNKQKRVKNVLFL